MNYYQKNCDGIMHTVRRGDTLYRLSRMYGVAVSDIMNVNPEVNVYNLQIGSTLCIPMSTQMPSPQPGRPSQPGMTPQPGRPPQPGMPPQPEMPPQPGMPPQAEMPPQPGMPSCPGMASCPGRPPQPEIMPRYETQPPMENMPDTDMSVSRNLSEVSQINPEAADSDSLESWNMETLTAPQNNNEPSTADDSSQLEAEAVWRPQTGMDWMMIMPYRVKRGDSLNSVLRMFQMDFDTFARFNPQIMPIPLKAGETVFVKRRRPQPR